MSKSLLTSALARHPKVAPLPKHAFSPGWYGYGWGMSGWDFGSGPYSGTVFGKNPKGIQNWDPRRSWNATSRSA